MKRILVVGLVAFSLMMGAIGFAQSITVVDNGPATPTTEVRSFGDVIIPTKSDIVVSVDSATSTEDITRSFVNLPVSAVRFHEIASTSALVMPQVPGVLNFQYNSDDNKLYIRLIENDGSRWGGSITLTTLN